MNDSKQVYLVDDDEAIRRSASFMLRSSGYSVKTFSTGVEFLDAVKELDAGCILLDVRMPEISGLEVQDVLNERGVAHPVVVMTGHGDVTVAVQAMKAGAVDFIEKPFDKAVLIEAIEDGFARLAQASSDLSRREQAQARLRVLTPRELDVLHGLALGHPNKTIAYDLGISPRTVEVHRANVMQKLEVASLSEALRIAFAAGLGSDQR
ncbi:MAG TPA: response regulator [Novosphingobium sp.]|nr:response regulator [Novosphingobium sp.]